VILFQIFYLSRKYKIANKKPWFWMKSVKKNTSMYKKENWPKNKTKSWVSFSIFLKNQAGIGLNLNFGINFNILSFRIIFNNWMLIWIM
jgi:hypothetical protein